MVPPGSWGAMPTQGHAVDAGTEYAAITEAFNQPALALLNRPTAPFVVTVFRTGFTSDRHGSPQPQFRRHVAAVIEALGWRGIPAKERDPLELCGEWVRVGWLGTDTGPDGEDVYLPSAAALDALRIIEDLARPQTVNSSRVQHILDLVEQAALLATGDRDSRMAHLEREITLKTAEFERLRDGGDAQVGSYSDMADRYDVITRELRSLPADFRRVQELIETARRDMAAEIITGGASPGQVLRDALSKAISVLDETPEGHAFTAVRDLLQGNQATMRDLQRNASTILKHEFAAALAPAELRGFADVTSVFNDNIDMVMDSTRSFSASIQGVTSSHLRGHTRREVAAAITAARAALLRHRANRVPGLPLLARAEIQALTQGMFDPDLAPPPRTIADFEASTATPMSREELAKWGGPRMVRLIEHIDAVTAQSQVPVPLSQLWDEAPEDLRRSVEISGYLTLAARHPDSDFVADATEKITAVRPDGSLLTWEVPLVRFATRRHA